jgi:dTDP-4-amino-4,6-dideoxy-D-galactose acyltransferase
MQHEVLEWDSAFFGVKVARLNDPSLSDQQLSDALSALRAAGVRLVYWPSDHPRDADAIARLGGHLADRKTTYFMDFRGQTSVNRAMNGPEVPDGPVEPHAPSMSLQELEGLAIQSGEHSRFALDGNIPREAFCALYKHWIHRALIKEMAQEVLVIKAVDRVVGMVTLGMKDGRGDIGLLAVDEHHRGKRHGERLLHAAQRWFLRAGVDVGQVVTQGANVPACRLYEKCGYTVETVQHVYHFWL